MAKVNNAILRFTPSSSPDVLGYALYVAPDPEPVEWSSYRCDLVVSDPDADGRVTAEFCELPGHLYDGIYNIGLVAIDDAGNESDMAIINGLNLDFVAPEPPTDPIVINP